MKDLVILVQGPSLNVKQLKSLWFDFPVIWSTWTGQENNYNDSDITLFNTLPSNPGQKNINLQKVSTLNGIKLARELGFSRVLKWRSDLIPTNTVKLVNCLDKEKINFLTWHSSCNYFVDYFMETTIDEMEKIWSFDNLNNPVPEETITEQILKIENKKYNYILDYLSDDCEIFWTKYNINLSSYKKESCYMLNRP